MSSYRPSDEYLELRMREARKREGGAVSAFEKLKALEAQKWFVSDPAIRAALPQIVAVVEAGERAYEHVEQIYPQGVAVDPVFREYAAALAALEEALL